MTRWSRGGSARVGILFAVTLAIVTALVVVSGAVDGVAGERTLVVTDENGTELVTVPVENDTEIVIEYTHSVEKTLVRDVYVTTESELVMTRMEFSSFGAGLPSRAEVTERDGRYVYYPPRAEYETLHLKTGAVADHDLIVDGERYDIAGLSDNGAVELSIERRLWTPF